LPVLVIFTLLDLLFTLFWVGSGLGSEANPLMAAAIDKSYLTFAMLKISLAYMGILILKKYEKIKIAFKVTIFAIIIYTMLMIWHMYGLYIAL